MLSSEKNYVFSAYANIVFTLLKVLKCARYLLLISNLKGKYLARFQQI